MDSPLVKFLAILISLVCRPDPPQKEPCQLFDPPIPQNKQPAQIPDGNGQVPLVKAILEGKYEACRTMLENGAPIDLAGNDGITPLMAHFISAKPYMFEMVLKSNPDLERKSKLGWTALMYASWNGHEDSIRVLLSRGANPNAEDSRGENAWTKAAQRGRVECCKILEAWGARPQRSRAYASPITCAAQSLQHDWILAVAAIPSTNNGESLQTPVNIGGPFASKGLVDSSWDIRDRKEALKMLDWLAKEGHREQARELGGLSEPGSRIASIRGWLSSLFMNNSKKGRRQAFLRKHPHYFGKEAFLAWDLVRVVFLARNCFNAKYISEEEFWERSEKAAKELQKNFKSWEAMSDDYLFGRQFGMGEDVPRLSAIQKHLLNPENQESPWVRLPWNLDLDANSPGAPGTSAAYFPPIQQLSIDSLANQAGSNCPCASLALATELWVGDLVDEDRSQALLRYEEALEGKYSWGGLGAGYALLAPDQQPAAAAQAAAAFKKSAALGNAEAAREYAELLATGNGVATDLKKALSYLEWPELRQDAEAQAWIGWVNEIMGKSLSDCLVKYKRASTLGNAWATLKVGECYDRGLGVEADPGQARHWYRRARLMGSIDAESYEASLLLDGRGGPQDLMGARKLFEHAARNGHVWSAHLLGRNYLWGNGGEYINYSRAAYWNRKAADGGNLFGAYNLGWQLEHGLGVGMNKIEAGAAYKKAYELGNDWGGYRLALLEWAGDIPMSKSDVEWREALLKTKDLGLKKEIMKKLGQH